MSAGEVALPLRWPIDLALTVASHGWARLAPWQWSAEAGRLQRRERIAGRIGSVAVRQLDPVSLSVGWDGFDAGAAPEILRRARRWLSAEWDPQPAITALAPHFPEEAALIAGGGGRLLRSSRFYEDFVNTVLTINASWSATCRMAAALVAAPGGGVFPTPDAVLDYGEARLRGEARLGFRAATVIAATRRLREEGAIDAAGHGEPERLDHAYLTSLSGIGPYAAAHCRLLLHDFSRIPVDSVVTADLRARFGLVPAAFLAAQPDCGDFLALGYKLGRLRHRLESEGEAPPADAVARPPRERRARR